MSLPSIKNLFVCVVALILLASSPLRGEVTAGVLGTVVDPTGAIVANATLTLTSADTGLVRRTRTDSSGNFEFLSVPVGDNYTLVAEATGFQKSTQTGIKLLVNQKYHADFKLAVLGVMEKVEVASEAAQVDTTNTQLGDVVEDKKMQALPLNGRSYIDLLGLQAGVVPVSSDAAINDRHPSGNGNSGNVSVNGQREAANSFLVNGGDVEESVNNGASIVPTLDSIQEFRLLTSSFNAEYGRFSGGIVNAVTKSGTNTVHGSLYEFLRNDKLDARNYFDPEKGALKRNQFGGTIGAPIVRNKLFIFGDYEGTRQIRGVSQRQNVPSELERTGDFSDLDTTHYASFLDSDGNPTVVRGDASETNFAATLTNRLGYTVNPGEPYWFEGCDSTDPDVGCVFPGAAGPVIPQAAWSPVAAATLTFLPVPTGDTEGTPFFATAAQNSNLRDDKFGLKVDFNHLGNWSFYYHFDDANFLDPYPAFTSNVPGFSATTVSRAQQFVLNHTSIFGSSAVNEAHVSFTRFAFLRNKPVGGLGKVTDFGYVEGGLGVNPTNAAYEGVAPIGFDQMGTAFGLPDGTTGQYNNTYQITDNFSKIIGKHTLKFGGDVRYIQVNERNTYTSNGWFTFSGSETGNDFADFLLGAPDLFNQTSPQLLDSRTKYFGLYAQDTYKVTPDLTLNYGLRWDTSQPFYDTKNRIQTFSPGVQSTIYPDAPEGFVFPGDPGVPKTLAPTQYDRFAPRFGLAYSPGTTEGFAGKLFGGPGKTSIRLSAGMFYTAIEDVTLFNEVGDAPFGLFWVSPVPVYLEEPYKRRIDPPDPVGNRFPFTIPAPGATGIWPVYMPVSGSPTYKLDNQLPYSYHFTFTLQRELWRSAVLSVGYVGTRGRHLLTRQEFNPGSAAACLAANEFLPPNEQCGPFGEDSIYNLTNGETVYGTRPFSVTSGRGLDSGLLDFASNDYEATIANSQYDSLQTSLEKKLGALRFLAAYTWSKSFDNSSGFFDNLNPFDPRKSRSLSAFDLTHNFVISYSYDLPSPKAGNGFAKALLSGWTVSGITRFTTGLPVTLSEGDDASLCGCSGADLPNYTGERLHFLDPRKAGNRWFEATFDDNGVPLAPFFPESLGEIGNANRRFFHGPGFNNWDFALHKNTRIGEHVNLEFRAEFFNLFNHTQFQNPDGSIDSGAGFGVISSARDPRIGQVALKLSF